MGFSLKSIGGAVGTAFGGVVGGAAGSMLGSKASGEGPKGGFNYSADPRAISAAANAGRKTIEQDIDLGRKIGKGFVPEGSLGRIKEDADIQAVMQAKRERLGGFSSQEQQAARDISQSNIQRQFQTGSRALQAQQARAGVRGAGATAQQMQLQQQAGQQAGAFERDLMLRQRAAQGEAIGDLEGSAKQFTSFDLGQASKEKFAQMGTALGIAQLGVTQRSGAMASAANVAAANAAKPPPTLMSTATGNLGISVICTKLYQMDMISKDEYLLNTIYGKNMPKDMFAGYLQWATPMAASLIFMYIFMPLLLCWSQELCHRVRPTKYKSNYLGKLVAYVFEKTSKMVYTINPTPVPIKITAEVKRG